MRLHLRRPWLAGFVVGLPIAVAALLVVALLPSLQALVPAVGPAAAIGIVVASIVMAELAAHRHVRPWVAVIAWIGVAHAIASVIVVVLAIAQAEASTLAATFGVLFGLVLLVLTLAVPWVVAGIAWYAAVRRISDAADQAGSTPTAASTADATESGS